MPVLAAMVGVAVLGFAVVDYLQSPATHKGVTFGPIFLPIQFGASPSAKRPAGEPTPSGNPAVSPPPVIGPDGLKSPLAGLLDRSHMPSSAFYSVMGGYVVNVSWAALQPSPGVLNTAPIDQAIALVRQANSNGAHMGLKLRVFAGTGAPNWAKNLGGPPFIARDRSSGATGTVGRFWTPEFGQAYQNLEAQLAARYDGVPELREVVIARCMTIYDEPMIRQISDPSTVAAMLAAGYTPAADEACQQQQIQAHTVWQHTRSDLAFNPYQYILPTGKTGTSEAFTEQMMDYCRATLGQRCILENNSLRSTSLGPSYTQMYAAIKTRGANIVFQTATLARIGNLYTTLTQAIGYGAASVELPSGYQNATNAAALMPASQQLIQNARS
jgi:hypothetical protein